jgi:hypothetical protein
MRNRKHLRVYQTLNSASVDDHLSGGPFVHFVLSMFATPTFKHVLKRQHHIYTHDEIDNVLDYLSGTVLKRGVITKIARDTGVLDQTLRDWHCQRAADKTWFPLVNGHPRAQSLSPESEAAVADFIRVNSIQPGIGATRTHLKHLCLHSRAGQTDDERHLEHFCASTTSSKHDLQRTLCTMIFAHHSGLVFLFERKSIRTFTFSSACLTN